MAKVLHKGVDARGNAYTLVRDKSTGGCKYIWDKGHVWAGFKGSKIDSINPKGVPPIPLGFFY